MSGRDVDPEDLSALARRGLLSDAEEAALEEALESSAELRALHTVGLDLDRSAAVRAGDDALVARAADAALARASASGFPRLHSVPPAKRRRRVAALLAAAIVFATGMGMAAAVLTGVVVVPAVWFTGGEEVHAKVDVVPEKRSGAQPGPAAREAVAAEAPEPLPVAPPEADANAGKVQPSPRAALSRPAAEDGAAALFSAGNTARRDGDFARAQRLYSDLIAKHPSSDEARLARVSLGKLLLAQGDPSDAERAFDDYLKGGKGQLAEEALVSRAESLQRMGRADDERRTWQRLLAEHPDSVYAAQARARLAALGRPGAAPAPHRANPSL